MGEVMKLLCIFSQGYSIVAALLHFLSVPKIFCLQTELSIKFSRGQMSPYFSSFCVIGHLSYLCWYMGPLLFLMKLPLPLQFLNFNVNLKPIAHLLEIIKSHGT